jgi:hypothetical protein
MMSHSHIIILNKVRIAKHKKCTTICQTQFLSSSLKLWGIITAQFAPIQKLYFGSAPQQLTKHSVPQTAAYASALTKV